ncbi:MAG: hypothetical protein R3D85_13085 [Paracoccaceae bacterium]
MLPPGPRFRVWLAPRRPARRTIAAAVLTGALIVAATWRGPPQPVAWHRVTVERVEPLPADPTAPARLHLRSASGKRFLLRQDRTAPGPVPGETLCLLEIRSRRSGRDLRIVPLAQCPAPARP